MGRANILGYPTFFGRRVSMGYDFIWKGNDKIKRIALINDIENGGLKMLDIQSVILSRRVVALKRNIKDYNSSWKSVLETLLGDNLSCKKIINE